MGGGCVSPCALLQDVLSKHLQMLESVLNVTSQLATKNQTQEVRTEPLKVTENQVKSYSKFQSLTSEKVSRINQVSVSCIGQVFM